MDRYFFEIANRPFKIAFLLGTSVSNRLINSVLKINTGLWGGMYNLICPTDGAELSDKFLGLLKYGKPDCIVLLGHFRQTTPLLNQLETNQIHPSYLLRKTSLSDLESFGIGIEGIFDSYFAQIAQRHLVPMIGVVNAGKGKSNLIEKVEFGIPPPRIIDYLKNRADLISVTQYRKEFSNKDTIYDNLTGLIQIGSSNIMPTARLDKRRAPSAVQMLIRRYTVFVIGNANSLEDSCYYWNVRACYGKDNVNWITLDTFDNLIKNNTFDELYKLRKGAPRIFLTAASTATQHDISDKVKMITDPRRRVFVRAPENIVSPLPYISLLCEKRTEHIATESGIAVIAVAIPHSFDIVFPKATAAHWAIDLRILRNMTVGTEGLILPNLPHMYGLITKNQTAILRPRVEGDVFSFQVRPKTEHIRLQLPTNWDVIRQIFSPKFNNISLSDQGKYMKRVLDMFGGLTKLYRLISDSRVTVILDEFLKHHRTGDKIADKTYRRSLTLIDMQVLMTSKLTKRTKKKIAETNDFVNQLVADFIRLGAIHSGYILDCPHCSLEDWYPIDEVTETFRCKRCLVNQQRPLSPLIAFKLNETFYQSYLGNFAVPLKALNFLRRRSRSSYIYCPQIKLDPNDIHSPELDIVAIQDGELVIGEAKSNSTVKKTKVDEMGDIAKIIKAQRIVFATSSRESCSQIECAECSGQNDFADNAWASREFIRDLRSKMEPQGTTVMSLCRRDL